MSRIIKNNVFVILICVIGLQHNAFANSTVFSLNFNKSKTGSSLSFGNQATKKYSTVKSKCGPDRSKCLETKYVGSKVGSARQGGKRTFRKANAYTLQYDVKFSKNFQWVKGGKLHGLGPKSPTTGCRPQKANGWSSRVMWRRNGIAELYIYDQTRKSKKQKCGWSYRSGKNTFKRGKWQAVSMYVKVNSVGKSNGEAELWVDGKRKVKKTGIKFRGTGKDTQISRFDFSTFFGGNDRSWSPSKTVSIQTDNFRVVKGRSIRNKAR